MASLLLSVSALYKARRCKSNHIDQSYVKDIQQKICENAAAEYSCITKEYHRNKSAKPRTIISDELSSTLNQLQSDLEVSDLYENMASRKNVLSRALPRTLIDKIGLEVLMQRLPEQVSFLYPTGFEQY
jgi:glutamate dehydrogenase